MAGRRGRCNNVELCSMATMQRVTEIPDGEPFICPRCSSELSAAPERKTSRTLRTVQLGAMALVAGCIGYAVYDQNRAPAASAIATARPAPAVMPAVQTAAIAPPPPTPPSLPQPMVVLRLSARDEAAGHLLARLAASYLAASGDADVHAHPGDQPGQTILAGVQDGRPEAISVTMGMLPDATPADVVLTLASALSAAASEAPDDGSGSQRVIGVDALAVLANPAVSPASLTPDQLRHILRGRLTDWSELGGAAGEIHAYVLAGSDVAAGAAHEVPDRAALLAAIGRDAGAVGLVALADADEAAGLSAGVRVMPVGPAGAAADPGSATYTLARRATLAVPAGHRGVAVQRFLAYAQSASAAAALAAADFLPPGPADVSPAPPADRLARYVAGAAALPVVFHFDANTVEVGRDNMHDIERLAAYLQSHHVSGDRLLLAGFADAPATAQRRAAAVAAALGRYGIQGAGTQGFTAPTHHVDAYLTPAPRQPS